MFFSHSSSLFNSSTIKQIIINFFKTYYINNNYYNSRIINDIIYNEKSHIVSKFKDNLISDDNSEFLKRFYTSKESAIRLPRFFEYHETYSRIYPNYTALPESKFIYKNIHRKQKIIDQQQNLEMSLEKRNKKRKNKDNKCNYEKQVFSTDVCNSLANDSSLMRSIFGLSKKNSHNNIRTNNKNINDKHIDQDNNDNNNSINEIEKVIGVIDKYQRSSNTNNTKHKKSISNSNHNLSTKRKQTTNAFNKNNSDSSCGNIITPSHVMTFSNHNIN